MMWGMIVGGDDEPAKREASAGAILKLKMDLLSGLADADVSKIYDDGDLMLLFGSRKALESQLAK